MSGGKEVGGQIGKKSVNRSAIPIRKTEELYEPVKHKILQYCHLRNG